MQRLVHKIQEMATMKNSFFFIALQTVLQILLVFFFGSRVQKYAPGQLTLDMRFVYDYKEAFNYLGLLGITGRKLYLVNELVDFIYPLAYGGAMILILAYFTKIPELKKWSEIVFLPMILMAVDFLENGSIVGMIQAFPNIEPWSTFGRILTPIKHTMVFISIFAIMITGLFFIKTKIFNKHTE